MKKSIDINCDLGEGFGNEASILPYISSANIASGYHAGDEETIHNTIALCLRHGVAIGAHPSFDDRENFGRMEMNLPAEKIFQLVQDQIMLMIKAAKESGGIVRHVKPHGALYNMAARHAVMASAIASAIKETDKTLILYGLSGSHLISEGEKAGLRVVHEVFADRSYREDGSLTPRSEAGALIAKANKVVAQCMQMIMDGTVTTLSGKIIGINAETICIHGDGPHAVTLVKAIYERLGKDGIKIVHPIP